MTQRAVVTLCSVGRDLWIASFAVWMERSAEPGRDKPKGGFIAWRLGTPLVGAGGRMERKDAINRAREGRISSGAALAWRWRGMGNDPTSSSNLRCGMCAVRTIRSVD